MRKLMIATSAVVLSIAGFAGVADAYPPSTPPTTEVIVLPPPPTIPPGVKLPETGGDIDDSLVFGASVAALGAGLILVTRRRRRAAEV